MHRKLTSKFSAMLRYTSVSFTVVFCLYTCAIGFILGGNAASGAQNVPNARAAQQIEACENFYRHVCGERSDAGGTDVREDYGDGDLDESEVFIPTPGEELRKKLYKRIQSILEESTQGVSQAEEAIENTEQQDLDVKELAIQLYKACLEGDKKTSEKETRDAVQEMLQSIGIGEWPLLNNSGVEYVKVLEKTGLRPVATIAAVPHPKNTHYILAVNAPFPRFGAYPDRMHTIRSHPEMLTAYQNLIRTVLKLIFDSEYFNSHQRNDLYKEEHNDQGTGEDQKSVEEDSNNVDKRNAAIEQVITDIIDVEVKIAEMALNARQVSYYQTDQVQAWQKRLGDKFPFIEGLSMDVKRAKRTLANNYEVGVHLLDYFKKLIEYLDNLKVKTFVNYVGWYFVRDVADVMTKEVREKLNMFLHEVAKPGIKVNLNQDHCIDKLVGYDGVMKDGIAHLYLTRFFGKEAVEKVSKVAQQLHSSFHSLVLRNTWMDEATRTKSSQWMNALKYKMGAPNRLFDLSAIKQKYELVTKPSKDSRLLYFYAHRDNNFLEMLRKNRESYDPKDIWPAPALSTYGRYSEDYASLDMPAGALQEPVFNYTWSDAFIYGSMATLTGETLAGAFMEEGRVWLDRNGGYKWSQSTKRNFRDRISCLKRNKNKQKKKPKRDSQEGFESRGDEYVLRSKTIDHIGLRTSYQAFVRINTENHESNEQIQRDFFTAFTKRQCVMDHEAEYRVNFALRTFSKFASAFKCKDDQLMKSEDTCDIVPRS